MAPRRDRDRGAETLPAQRGNVHATRAIAEGPIALVTHGGPIRLLLQHLGVAQPCIDFYRRQFDRDNPLPPAGAWCFVQNGTIWSGELAFAPQPYRHYAIEVKGDYSGGDRYAEECGFLCQARPAVSANNSLLCVGLDPNPDRIPERYQIVGNTSLDSILTWNRAIIEDTQDLVCAYKPNIAFYEALGSAGIDLLEQTIELIPSHVPVILGRQAR